MIHSNRHTILKYSGYALLMLGLFVLQTSRGTAIHLWGAAVNAMPFFVAAVALLDGPYAGGVLAFLPVYCSPSTAPAWRASALCCWECAA